MGLKQAIDRVRPSTLQVAALASAGSGRAILGTAFIVADGYAVTAKHVIDALARHVAGGQARPHVGFAGPNIDSPTVQLRIPFAYRPFIVAAQDVDNDIALLQYNSEPLEMAILGRPSPEPHPVRIRSDRPDEGEPVGCSGYPLAEPSLVTTTGVVASAWAQAHLDPQKIIDRYLADLTANGGNSGGPVYRTTDGKVIGVLVAGKTAAVIEGAGRVSSGLSIVVPARAVVDLMAANDLTPLR